MLGCKVISSPTGNCQVFGISHMQDTINVSKIKNKFKNKNTNGKNQCLVVVEKEFTDDNIICSVLNKDGTKTIILRQT